MADVNSIQISGNITSDPELREVGDNYVLNLSIAHNTRRRDGDEWVDGDPVYLQVALWGKVHAQNAAKSLRKGQRVVVTGSLKMSTWEDKNTGDPRSRIEVTATDVAASSLFGIEAGGKGSSDSDEEPF